MAEGTKIEWADRTWSPWVGCQKVGPGCDHCYAEALNKRGGGSNWGPGAPRRRTTEAYWRKALAWNRQGPATVFPSMCDPFDNAVDPIWRRDFASTITATSNLTWLLLTKRIGNAPEMLAEMFPFGIPANVWVGATIVNQAEADRDRDKLAAVPAAVRFVSYEPALGPVDWTGWEFINWLISGGESGPKARPAQPDWFRESRDWCAEHDVAYLHKQNGEFAPGEIAGDYLNPERGVKGLTYYADGYWGEVWSEPEMHCDYEPDVYRVGKKRAGRLLDGVEHNGFPQVRRP